MKSSAGCATECTAGFGGFERVQQKNGRARAWLFMRTLSMSAPASGALALSVLVWAIAGCSADASEDSDRRGTSTPPGRSGTAGGNLAPMQSAVDNPSAMPTPTLPTATAGAASPPRRQRTPNTEIDREPIAIDDCGPNNAAGLSPDDVQLLKAGSGSADGLRWLYPYDGTVFPRGMLAPDLMWEGPADVIYVRAME
jgi:hypothetical protein